MADVIEVVGCILAGFGYLTVDSSYLGSSLIFIIGLLLILLGANKKSEWRNLDEEEGIDNDIPWLYQLPDLDDMEYTEEEWEEEFGEKWY